MTPLDAVREIQSLDGKTDPASRRRFDEVFKALEQMMAPHIEVAIRGIWRNNDTYQDLRQSMRVALYEAARVMKPKEMPTEEEQVRMVCGYLKSTLQNQRKSKLYGGHHDDPYTREVGTSRTQYVELDSIDDGEDLVGNVEKIVVGKLRIQDLHQVIELTPAVKDISRKNGKRSLTPQYKVRLHKYLECILQGMKTSEAASLIGISYDSANWLRDDLRHILGPSLGRELPQQNLIHKAKRSKSC